MRRHRIVRLRPEPLFKRQPYIPAARLPGNHRKKRNRRIQQKKIDKTAGARLPRRGVQRIQIGVYFIHIHAVGKHIERIRSRRQNHDRRIGAHRRDRGSLEQGGVKHADPARKCRHNAVTDEQHRHIGYGNAAVDEYKGLDRKRGYRQKEHHCQGGKELSQNNLPWFHGCGQHQLQRLLFTLAADAAGRQGRHNKHQHNKFDGGHKSIKLQKTRILDLCRNLHLANHRIHIKQRRHSQDAVENQENRRQPDAAAVNCQLPPINRIPFHVVSPPFRPRGQSPA